MTKDEMMCLYYYNSAQENYEEAQRRIAMAMSECEKYVYLPGKCASRDFAWTATPETIARLKEDGFDVDKVWSPLEYWSIEWGY